jgi:peptide/nickel transport system permease protein
VTKYIIRRLALLPVTVLLLSIFVFAMIRLVPGSVVDARLGERGGTVEDRQRLEAHFGLDKPVPVQYVRWLRQIATGDLGRSWLTNETIASNIQRRMPVTLWLMALTMVLYLPLGIGMGVLSAVQRNRPEDYAVRLIAIFFLAVPNFWLATLVIILPLMWWGYAPPAPYVSFLEDPARNLRLVLPGAMIAAISGAAVLARVTRSELLEVLRQDYVRTAYAKGLESRVIFFRHALRNTMLPLVTILGLVFASGIAGTVIIEQIFSIPGMGRYIVTALQTNDLPIVQAWMLIFGTIFVLINLVVDLSYAVLDPRTRLS